MKDVPNSLALLMSLLFAMWAGLFGRPAQVGAQPSAPAHVILATHDLPPSACCLTVDRSLAIVGYDDHLLPVDLRDPTQPRRLDPIDPGGGVSSMVLDQGRLYLAIRDGGLAIYELKSDAPARRMGGLSGLLGAASAMDVRDGRLAATVGSDLILVDVSRPEAPRELDRLGLFKPLHGVALGEGGIAVLSSEAGMILIDDADPSNLRMRGIVAVMTQATDLDVRGRTAVVSSYEFGSFGPDGADPRPPMGLSMPPVPITSRIDAIDTRDLADPRPIDAFEFDLGASQGLRQAVIDDHGIHVAGPVYVPGANHWALDSFVLDGDCMQHVSRLNRGGFIDGGGRLLSRSLSELASDGGRIYALEQVQGMESPASTLLVTTPPVLLSQRIWLPNIGAGWLR